MRDRTAHKLIGAGMILAGILILGRALSNESSLGAVYTLTSILFIIIACWYFYSRGLKAKS